ncbi:Pentatricopeptide repeat [Cinnamomum micranthum f. kanehirae]|uniref:Pentatricopeptide repeat n=1 Tax=Cinnamomum micranthum f. kanehirae TaxID=337451 RepID=A0A443NKK0_9MAGN|nr:Pentatricopeptide repeat [Cinnamomum micranthum f. kanehirae]
MLYLQIEIPKSKYSNCFRNEFAIPVLMIVGQNEFGCSNFLRRKRKWPQIPYKGRWQQTFNEQQAMETLKKTAILDESDSNPKTHILSTLINSFRLYGCDTNPSAYSFVISNLAQRSLFSQLPTVLDHLENIEKFETPERMFTDLIRSYGEAGMFQDAIDIFFRIPKFRCIPSASSLNSLLLVLCKKRESLVLVYDVLMRSLEMKIRLEDSTFHLLVKALCRYGKMSSAIEILNLMEDHGCIPDSKMYSMILSSLCKHAGSVEVLHFLEEMLNAGFTPNGSEYVGVVTILVKEGRAKDAFDVLNRMKREGVKPDIVSYTSVLNGFFSVGDFQKGEQVFDEMLVMGLVPDPFTYSVYINGLCKQNNFEGALKMLVSMEEVGCRPDVVTYNVLITAFCKVGDVGKARELVGKMHLQGLQGNLHTYRILIDGLLSAGDVVAAFGVLVEMLNRGFVPRSSTFSSMVCGLCVCCLPHDALQVLEEMVKRSVAPEARAWEALLLSSSFSPSCTETLLDLEGLTAAN